MCFVSSSTAVKGGLSCYKTVPFFSQARPSFVIERQRRSRDQDRGNAATGRRQGSDMTAVAHSRGAGGLVHIGFRDVRPHRIDERLQRDRVAQCDAIENGYSTPVQASALSISPWWTRKVMDM